MKTETPHEYAFDTETVSQQVGDHHWQLTMASSWNIGKNPNGGYILACLLRSMATLVPNHPDPISVTAHYLRPGLPGKVADINATITRQGRRTATVSGSLVQDGKPGITCTATFGNLDNHSNSEGHSRDLQATPPVLPPPDECTTRSALAQAVELPIMNRLDIRVDPQHAESGNNTNAIINGWIKFRDERPVDSLALALFCDSFPPSVFTLFGPIGWVPTLELSVHVRRRPQPGWIKGSFTTTDLAGDLFIEDGILWDQTDQLVAQSRQLQMILS